MWSDINGTLRLWFVLTGPSMLPSELMAEMRNSGFALKKCVLGRNSTVCDPSQVIFCSSSPPEEKHQQYPWQIPGLNVIAANCPIIRVNQTTIPVASSLTLVLSHVTYIYIYNMNKNINGTCKVLVPCFMSWNKISQRLSIHTKRLCKQIVHNLRDIPVSEHFSFAKIIHPPDRFGISRTWLNSMIITQMHFVLVTKGNSKLCSFITTQCHRCLKFCRERSDCRNVHQSCSQRIWCSFLYHKPPPTHLLHVAFIFLFSWC